MKRILKTATAMALIIAIIFSFAIVAYAEAPESGDPYYLPLKKTVEYAGSTVGWDDIEHRIVLNNDEDTYIFFLHRQEAYKNGEAYSLIFPIYVENDSAYASYYDIAFLFEDESEYLSSTILTTVLTTMYLMEMVSVPGVTVAIVDAKNGFTWTQGFGYADEDGACINELTLFNLASISKSFTAVAVMQLVEKGLIDLDKPVVTYLPGFSTQPDISGEGDYRNITVRMLLAHASGIYPDITASGVATRNGYNVDYMDNFLETLAGMSMVFPEASAYSYANNSFTLLGVLVAAVTGADSYFDGFVDYTQKNIFDPAGMDLTTFALGEKHKPYIAPPYEDAARRDEFIYYNALPAGGIFSNAHDMARYMHTLLSGGIYDGTRLISDASVAKMMEPQDFNFDHSIDFLAPNMHPGLGLIYATGFDGFTHIGHSGNLIHYHSDMAFDTDSGIGVFVSTNSITGMSIAQLLSITILQNAVYEKTGKLDVPQTDYTVVPIALPAEELMALEGIYALAGESELINIILEQDGMLYVYNISGLPFPLGLIPLSDGSFVNPDTGLRFWFEDMEGEILVYLGEFKTHLFGAMLDPELYLAPESFGKWTGTYVYYPEKENYLSIVSHMEVGVDPNGFAYIRMYALHGLAPITVLIYIDDNTYYAGELLQFILDGESAKVSVSGTEFVRKP